MKWIWVVVVLSLVVLGAMVWVMNDIDRKRSETAVEVATILDWYPDESGIVITVSVNGKLYKLHTNASLMNVEEPVKVVFEKGVPVAVLQEYRSYSVLDWEELKTLEKMPAVQN